MRCKCLITLFLFTSLSAFCQDHLLNGGLFTKSFNQDEINSFEYEREFFNHSIQDKNSFDLSLSGVKNKMSFLKKIQHKSIADSLFNPSRKQRTRKFNYTSTSVYEGKITAYINQKKDSLEYTFYKSDSKDQRPLIIIFPPIMGETYIDQNVSSLLASKQAHVLHIKMSDLFKPGRSIKNLSDCFFNILSLSQRLITEVIKNDQVFIDHKKIGVFGVSLGAIVAATLAGISDEVSLAYLIGAGGNLPYIANKSTRESIVKFRNYSLSNHKNLNHLEETEKEERWYDISSRAFETLDPMSYAQNIKHKKIFMQMSSKDTTVPFVSQVELWKAFGSQEYRLYHMSHISMIIRWFIEDQSHLLGFFLD